MKKRILFLLFAVLSVLPHSAQTFEVDGLHYKITGENTCSLTRVPDDQPAYEGDFVVPQSVTYDGTEYSVTDLGDGFFHCRWLKSVVIPNSITEIGARTFCGCYNLTSISIPNSVLTIGFCAFQECTSLTSIVIPSSVTSIGEYLFYNCSSLTSITLSESVTEFGVYPFWGCSELTSITYLAENPIEFGSDLFGNENYEKATLNYLESAAEKINNTAPWNLFKNRVGRSADFVDTGIEEISSVSDGIAGVYNLGGVKVGESLEGLTKGIYIVRQGDSVTKVVKN